jgi:adenosylcobinamide-phosphate synthase
MVLDAALGEPRWLWDRLPHPAVLIGRAIGWADQRFNCGPFRRMRGMGLTIALVILGAVLGHGIAALGWLPDILLTAMLLAQKSLTGHVAAVGRALRLSIPAGRLAVAQIVGRDTQSLDSPGIARAAIESAAENLSDGVIAPIFWYLVAGLPGLLIYKAVNTADSMIGYRTPKHRDFGWASARLDDVLNLIPARLTALLILIAARHRPDWRALRAEARLHRSPNAGWPEAAMARALNIALSGPRSYHGAMRDFPWVHPTGNRSPGPMDIDRAVAILWRCWALALVVALLLASIASLI